MKLKELTIPIAIVLSTIIIGGILYAIQVNKQNSIEKQAQMKIEADRLVELEKLRLEEEKLNRETLEATDKKLQEERADKFTNNLKCQELLTDLRKKWNNVVGISYDSLWNSCRVKYIDDDGEVQSGLIQDMIDK